MPQIIVLLDSRPRADAPRGEDFARRLLTCFILSISTITGAVLQPHIDPRTVRLPMVDGEGIRFTRITTADGLSQTRGAQIVQEHVFADGPKAGGICLYSRYPEWNLRARRLSHMVSASSNSTNKNL